MRFLGYVDAAQRFALRELEQGDLAELESMNKSLFYPYLRHVTGPRKLLDGAISAQSDEPRTLYFIGITPHGDRQRLIGLVGAAVTDVCAEDPAHLIEVGYALIPSFQKRGIARSALQAALPRLLTSQITEVLATVDPDNLPSIRLLEACGFERFGQPKPSKYLGDPDNPAHYEAGVLQLRPRISYRIKADAFG
jgi:RimJ/RimL family protein N-acetyltransferase